MHQRPPPGTRPKWYQFWRRAASSASDQPLVAPAPLFPNRATAAPIAPPAAPADSAPAASPAEDPELRRQEALAGIPPVAAAAIADSERIAPAAAASPPAAEPAATREVLAEIRRLAAIGQASAGLALCEAYFGQRRDIVDEYRHPIYLKESVRLSLLMNDVERAHAFAQNLQPAIAPADPCIQVLFARHFTKIADRERARAEWRAALARDPRNNEAQKWLADDAAREGVAPIGGLAPIASVPSHDLAGFATGDADHRLTLFPALLPPRGAAPWAEVALPANAGRVFDADQTPPAGEVHALAGATLTGAGFLIRDRRFLAPEGVFPDYLHARMRLEPHDFEPDFFGALDRRDVEILTSDAPLAVALHPNLVWGHFLLEMLPRLFLIGQLDGMGRSFTLAVPSNCRDWVKQMVALYVPAARTMSFDPRRQCIAAPFFIAPTMMQNGAVLSPVFNLLVSDLLARCGVPENGAVSGPERIYLSRSRFQGGHRLLNEAEVEATLGRMDFTIVHPETLSFAEQVRICHGARIIVGEYSSALHNALFARRGARVVALSWINQFQEAIARVRSQSLAFVQPDDGVWRNGSFKGERRNFRIDPAALRRTVERMLAAP